MIERFPNLWCTRIAASILLLLFGPVVLFASTPAKETSSTSSTFEIQGVVLDSGIVGPSAELPGKTVRLIAVEGASERFREIERATTDESGRFLFQVSRAPTENHLNRLSYLVLAILPEGGIGEARVRESTRSDNLTVRVSRKTATLRGRVKDHEGFPVAEATIRYNVLSGESLEGLPKTTTNENGLFLLPRLPAVDGTRGQPGAITLCLEHPGFPRTFVPIRKCPDIRTINLHPGCILTGSVVLSENASLESLEVAAIRNDPIPDGTTQHQDVHTLTDASGHFQMIVPPGRYHVQLNEDEEWVAPALMNIQCPAGTSKSLPPLVAGRGGWIEGRVVDSSTGTPVAKSADNAPMQIGLIGPHRPGGNPRRPVPLCTVDSRGNFRLRVSPGDQFPYLIHPDGERTVWNTREQPPVSVFDGKRSEIDLVFRPSRTPEELLDETMTFIGQLPVDPEERTLRILKRLRQYDFLTHEADAWAALLRELILIGTPAVPRICEELEATDHQRMMRRLVFVLRAINDPNCVPVLIRTLPKTLQHRISTSELIVEDRDLLDFMACRDCSNESIRSTFQLAPPVQEVLVALETITQHSEGSHCLDSLRLTSDADANAFAKARFATVATRWANWWNTHSDRFSVEPSNRKVLMSPTRAIDIESVAVDGNLPREILSPDTESGDLYRSLWLTPLTSTNGKGCFIDLDTRCVFSAPEDLIHNESTQDALIQWGRDHGADIVCMLTTTADGREVPSLRLIDSQAWEIATPADQMARWINVGQLPTGRRIDKFLHSRGSESSSLATKANSNFLYFTREKGLGVITLKHVPTRDAQIDDGHPMRIGFDLEVIYR
ncbi:hypothetical protein KOR42_45840 [Thalassoglobus neptunius]|uniref:Uncharacterized protein n=1 Tax=Thalassoglobus neptunius TaxID=1938619 RepID=A0A5C5VWT0_9PLAN|nr:carboxypeptidase-like regulatory domain-containing protein [Thalassoglobus neptunius]TWT42984.1 hypothetical protein KOR42_45840 [Thalassoglobus neptunius]